MTQQLKTFQDYTVKNSITNKLNDEKFDLNGPFSFIEYLDYAQILDNSTQNIDNYKKYLIEWDSLDLNTGNEETNTIRDQFIILFKDINQNYTTVEERRYLKTIDFNNEENLSIALPFFANKIKEICIYYKQKRNNYLRDLSTIDARGSKDGVQDYIKNAIVDLFFGDQSSTNLASSLSLSAMQINLEIGIEEGYDIYNDIFDTDQSVGYDSPTVLESIEIIQPDGTTTTTTTTTTPQPVIPSTTPKPVLPAQLWEFNDPCEPTQTNFTNSTWFSSYWTNYNAQTQGISQFYVEGDKMIWGLNAKTFPYKINQTGTDYQWYWLEYYDIDNNYLGWSGESKSSIEEQYIFVPINAAETTYHKEVKEADKPPEGTFTVWLMNNFGAAAVNVYNTPIIDEEGLNPLGGSNLPWIGYPLEETNYTPPISTREDWRADEMPKRLITDPVPIFDDYFIPGRKDNTMYFNAWPIHANVNVEGTLSFTRGLKDGKETLYANAHWTGTAAYNVDEYQRPFLRKQTPPPELDPLYAESVFPPPVGEEPTTFYNGIQKVNFYYTDENDEIINLDAVDVPSSTYAQYVWDKVGVITKTACDQLPINAFNNYEIPANAAYIWLTWESNRTDSNLPYPLERQICHPLSDIT